MNKTKICKISKFSLMTTIPKILAEAFEFEEGDELYWEIKTVDGKQKLVIDTKSTIKEQLDEER
jgi:antitoxin component of MazEF toxin-antitoxin module